MPKRKIFDNLKWGMILSTYTNMNQRQVKNWLRLHGLLSPSVTFRINIRKGFKIKRYRGRMKTVSYNPKTKRLYVWREL